MNKPEIMVELIRIAAATVSPTVGDRALEVAQTAKQWYKECIDDTLSIKSDYQQEEAKPARRVGRPPKTVTE